MAASVQHDAYKFGSKKASNVVSKSKNLRSTLSKLFNKRGGEQDDFQPGPSRQSLGMRRKGKGKGPMKGPAKRKVKEFRVKVVDLTRACTNVPVAAERESLMKTVWIRETASSTEVKQKIQEAFGWGALSDFEYMYVNGRYMRPATLEDVENAEEWDAESVRALMGSGCLYVSGIFQSEDGDESSASDDDYPVFSTKDSPEVKVLHCIERKIGTIQGLI